MENKILVTGIDIGTTKVVAVIAEIYYNYDTSATNNDYKWPIKEITDAIIVVMTTERETEKQKNRQLSGAEGLLM